MIKKITSITLLLAILMAMFVAVIPTNASTIYNNDPFLGGVYNKWQMANWNPDPQDFVWMSGGVAETYRYDSNIPCEIGNICYDQGYNIWGGVHGDPFDPVPLTTSNLKVSITGKHIGGFGYYGGSYVNLWGMAGYSNGSYRPVGDDDLHFFEIQIWYKTIGWSLPWATYDVKSDAGRTWYRAIVSAGTTYSYWTTRTYGLNMILAGMQMYLGITAEDLQYMGITEITFGVEAWAGACDAGWTTVKLYS